VLALARCRLGVRADREGVLRVDYLTAQDGKGATTISRRYYLADAVFLAGLEGEAPLLGQGLDLQGRLWGEGFHQEGPFGWGMRVLGEGEDDRPGLEDMKPFGGEPFRVFQGQPPARPAGGQDEVDPPCL
ncbi:MAG: hypothetical protein C4298_00970, partial [Thermus sp.]